MIGIKEDWFQEPRGPRPEKAFAHVQADVCAWFRKRNGEDFLILSVVVSKYLSATHVLAHHKYTITQAFAWM